MFKFKKIVEDAPANSVGSGSIAGLGVGSQGEPGVTQSVSKRHKKRAKASFQSNSPILAVLRRKASNIVESTVPMGRFAGNDTFIVSPDKFHKARTARKKGMHWKKYIDLDEHGLAIREYHRKHKGKRAIILQCERTGAMHYASYGKRHER